jgi:hypothetical protein
MTNNLRSAWEGFLSNVPVPCLWVTAHLFPLNNQMVNASAYPALTELLGCTRRSASADTNADAYRRFLQKTLTPLNRKILKSRDASSAFAFRGVLERNGDDRDGSRLHYHFFLWHPGGLFATDPTALIRTRDCLNELWLSRVPVRRSERFKPFEALIVSNQGDLSAIADYELKRNTFRDAYELFDDWRTSAQERGALPERPK